MLEDIGGEERDAKSIVCHETKVRCHMIGPHLRSQ
jgi:hypothetical protein